MFDQSRTSSTIARARIERQLLNSQSILHRNTLANAFRDGIRLGARTMAILSVPAGIALYFLRSESLKPTAITAAVVAAVVLVGILIPVVAVVRGSFVKPDFCFAAERLDAALKSNNCIASALDLSGQAEIRGDLARAFADCAVEEAVNLLKDKSRTTPVVRSVEWQTSRFLANGLFAAGVLVLAAILPPFFSRHDLQFAQTSNNRLASEWASSNRPALEQSILIPGQASLAETPQVNEGQNPSESNRSQNGYAGSHSDSGGNASGGSDSQEEPGDSAQSSDPSKPVGEKNPPSLNSMVKPGGRSAAHRSNSGVTPGARGASAFSPVGKSGQIPGKSDQGDSAEQSNYDLLSANQDARDLQADVEVSSPDSLPGSQPPFGNGKEQAVSRELTVAQHSSNTGRGNGRTAENSPKKSRGVAAFLFGVPVPSFVQGHLLPGISRSIEKPIPPQVQAGQPAQAAQVPEPVEDEPNIDRYDVPNDGRSVVQSYFISMHHEAEISTEIESDSQ